MPTDDLQPTTVPLGDHRDFPRVPPDRGLTTATAEELGVASGDVLTVAGAACFADDSSLPDAFRLDVRWHDDGWREAEHHRLRGQVVRPSGSLVDVLTTVADHAASRAPRGPERTDAARTVIQELLVNAVGHRSWAAAHLDVPVRLTVYTDAVHVWSPGGLPDPVALRDGWFQGRLSRNPYLMRLLTMTGLARQHGYGTHTVRQLARSVGWRATASQQDGGVLVRLQVDLGLASLSAREVAPSAEGRRDRIVELLRQAGPLPTAEIATRLGARRKTIQADIRRLRDEGLVHGTEAEPRSPNQRWALSHPRR